MLALLAVEGSRLDAGSVGLAVARRWSDSGERVLFVDADMSGARLAERLGAAKRAEYSPADRGLPSLMVAREPLNLKTAVPHCYSMAEGALWTLFAPFHPAGGELAAAWLADRAAELEAIDRQRTVVLASSMRPAGSPLDPLLRAAAVVVVLAPVETGEQAAALWELLRGAGLMGFKRAHRALIVEGESPLDDDEIRVEAGMHVVGRLPVIEDDRVLRLPGGRRERTFTRRLDAIAARLLAAVAPDNTETAPSEPVAEPEPVAESEPVAEPEPVAGPEPVAEPEPRRTSVETHAQSAVNGAEGRPGPVPARRRQPSPGEKV